MTRLYCSIACALAVLMGCAQQPIPNIQHGIIDIFSIEGVIPGTTSMDEVTRIAGNAAFADSTANLIYWHFPDYGLKIGFLKATKIVASVHAYDNGWQFTIGANTYRYSIYPYPSVQGLMIGFSSMDSVQAIFGKPDTMRSFNDSATTAIYPRYFEYSRDTLGRRFVTDIYYRSDGVANYQGKPICRISIF
jgi:hypothetical protein